MTELKITGVINTTSPFRQSTQWFTSSAFAKFLTFSVRQMTEMCFNSGCSRISPIRQVDCICFSCQLFKGTWPEESSCQISSQCIEAFPWNWHAYINKIQGMFLYFSPDYLIGHSKTTNCCIFGSVCLVLLKLWPQVSIEEFFRASGSFFDSADISKIRPFVVLVNFCRPLISA